MENFHKRNDLIEPITHDTPPNCEERVSPAPVSNQYGNNGYWGNQPSYPSMPPSPFLLSPGTCILSARDVALLRESYLHDYMWAVRRIEYLQNQVEKNALAEQAYADIRVMGNRTYTFTKTGRASLLLNCAIAEASFFTCHPLLNRLPFYLIRVTGSEDAVLLEEKDFFRDNEFISALQRMRGVAITIQKTVKTTATLLRMAVDQQVKSFYLDFYAGWRVTGGDSFKFGVFPGFKTHQDQGVVLSPAQCLNPTSPAVAAAAATQFWPVFRVITDPFSRWLFMLSFHEAALHTLLEHLGSKVPLAIAAFSDDAEQTAYLKQLFGWFGDSALTPDERPKNLAMSLLTRKDQPVLVVDCGRLSNKQRSMEILEGVLVNGTVPLKICREEKSFPLQGPLIILSNRMSALTVAPEVMVLDIPPGSFDRDLWVKLNDYITQNLDYVSAVVTFTERRIGELQAAIKRGKEIALQRSQRQLNENCLEMLGVLLGLDLFLAEFFKFCPDVVPPTTLHDAAMIDKLTELMCQTTEKGQWTSLADQFLLVGKSQIEQGILRTYSTRTMAGKDEHLVVYYDAKNLYFTPEAFFHVCETLSQSRPSVLYALTDLFTGPQANRSTAQTRVTVYNVYGQPKSQYVYAIGRDAFDEVSLGDPLILEEEDV